MAQLDVESWLRIPRTRREYLENVARKQFGNYPVFIMQGSDRMRELAPELRYLDDGDWYGVIIGLDYVIQ